MSDRKALIVWGGWDGHEPELVAKHFAHLLRNESFEVEVSDTLDAFCDYEKLSKLNLIVPLWTMGSITAEQRDPVMKAIAEDGVGLAGCHGGMCDSFRMDTEWQFMTGGQWVAHPGNDGIPYMVNICRDNPHPITNGIADFLVASEQYYLHTDPANNVLATTDFPHPSAPGPHAGNPCKMPQVWTRTWGKGRVFYSALGHVRKVFDVPEATEIQRRGMLWAAKGVGL